MLMLAADGFNPFDKKNQITMWPILLKVLNHSPENIAKRTAFIMVGIVPGPFEPKSLQVYLDLLVDELIKCWQKGIDVQGVGGAVVKVYPRLLLHGGDYPALCKMMGVGGSAAHCPCLLCLQRAERRSFALDRMVHGEFRRFLPLDHAYRTDQAFGHDERRSPPAAREQQDTLAAAINVGLERIHGNNDAARKRTQKQTGVFEKSALLRLNQHYPYCLHGNCALDSMHTNSCVLEKLVKTMRGEREVSELRAQPSAMSRDDYARESKYRQEALSKAENFKISEEVAIAQDRLWKTNPGPSGYIRNKASPLRKPGSMKMHDWRVFCRYRGKAMLLGTLGIEEYRLVRDLLTRLGRLSHKRLKRRKLGKWERQLCETLSVFEQKMPPTDFAPTLHQVVHFPELLRQWGPLYYYWMYSLERFLCWLSRLVHNKAAPEQEMANNYLEAVCARVVVHDGSTKLTQLLDSSPAGRRLAKVFLPSPVAGVSVSVVFPRLRASRGVRRIDLSAREKSEIRKCLSLQSGSQEHSEISTTAWKITRPVLCKGAKRSTAAKFMKAGDSSGFLLKNGPTRSHLRGDCEAGRRICGRICFFLAVKFTGGSWLQLAKVILYCTQASGLAKEDRVIMSQDHVYATEYISADEIGDIKVFTTIREDEIFNLVLNTPELRGLSDSD